MKRRINQFICEVNLYFLAQCVWLTWISWLNMCGFFLGSMYVWRTWIESTGGAEAQPRNQQTSTPTTDQQTDNGIHENFSDIKWG